MSNKMIVEGLGTFILVVFGRSSALLLAEKVGMHGIATAFGLSIAAATYG